MEKANEVDKVRMQDSVPMCSLENLELLYDYADLESQRRRYQGIMREYKRVHSVEPDFFSR